MAPVDPSATAAGDGKDWLAFGLAFYGAAVATAVGVYQFFRDRPGIKVFITPSTTNMDDGDGTRFEQWVVRYVNHRKRPITLTEGGVVIKGLRVPWPAVDHLGKEVPYPFPMTLADGESRVHRTPRNEQWEVSGAWAKDALERSFEARYPSRSPRARIAAWREAFRTRKL